jgi:tRNA(Ile)-lysidine synthase
MAGLLAAVARAPETPLLVAFSGGLDSTVLLHALAADAAVRARGLRALHVQHDLQDAAGAWAGHCERMCADLKVPISVARVQVPRDSGLAWRARRGKRATPLSLRARPR